MNPATRAGAYSIVAPIKTATSASAARHFLWTVPVSVALLAGVALGFVLAHKAPRGPVEIRDLTQSGGASQPSISRDGRIVVYVSRRLGHSQVWIKDVEAGHEWPLTTGVNDTHPRLSPDGSAVLFVRHNGPQSSGIFVVSTKGGEPRRVLDRAMEADWSPDGKRMVFVRHTKPTTGTWTIGLLPISGEGAREIFEVDALELTSPRWAPNGRRIAFRRFLRPNEAASIFVLDPVSGVRSTIPSAPGGFGISSLAWLRESELLYMQSLGPASSAGASRAMRHNLTSGASHAMFWTASPVRSLDLYSPQRAVFDSGSLRQNLREISLTTGEHRWLTHGPAIDRQPAYSPDGSKILFASNRNGRVDLWEIAGANGALRRLTNDFAEDSAPLVMPDGKHFIWSSMRSGKRELWSADTGGGSPRQLTQNGTDAESPAATPDGRYIVYQNFAGFHRIDSDGSAPKLLDADLCFYPSISPDSRYVACANGTTIRVLEVSSGARVRFEIHKAARPVWMPDGRGIAFIGEDARGVPGIFVQAFAPGRDTDALRRPLAPFDPDYIPETFAISPVGSRIVVSMTDPVSDLMIAKLP